MTQQPESDPGYVEALQRIAVAQKTGATSLKLILRGLRELPPEIGQLKALTQLDVSGNQLTTLPSQIGQLTALRYLDVSGNQLTALAAEIGQLTVLAELNVHRNQLTTLPPEIGQLTALTNLDVSLNQLKTLPPEIGQLTALTKLEVGSNQLTTLPPEIGQLDLLKDLDISGNQLTPLPPEIGQLTALGWLNVCRIQLTTLPPEIGQLKELRRLYITDNQLTTLPPEIGQLTALTGLFVGYNKLTTLPPEIGQLTALAELYVHQNQLTTLPPEIGQLTALSNLYLQSNQLTTLPDSIKNLSKLEVLALHENPALNLAPSILGDNPEGNINPHTASPKSILDYYFGRQTEQTRPLNEVKLILVGRGSAGKTSTVRALRGLKFIEGEHPTPGIALCDWTMTECKKGPVTAHVWDFAGQVITHALHQFFFSERSVYIVVLTGRENHEREDAEYWLRLIKAFGTDGDGVGPPVIVALNKWDVKGSRPKVDRGGVVERYPFIRGFVETDCKSNRGIENLKTALGREVDRLKWVREPFPKTWDAVRRALSKPGQKRAHLTYAAYRTLCRKQGVTDARTQDSLAEILHNLGAAINYRNDPRLHEATVLQPQWLTKNVYALVRRAEQQAGVLNQSDVDSALSKVPEPEMRDYLVRIMERFEIAYMRPSGEVWLVPQALPDEQPTEAREFSGMSDATRLRYTYPALPEGLVPRAIVRLHEFIEEVDETKRQWASGAILSRDNARALLRTEPPNQVMLTVTGPSRPRQQLAGLCQADMRDIHREIPGLDPLEETQVNGAWVATATLEADEKKGGQTGVPTRDQGTVMIDPTEPNNAYSQKAARNDEIWKPSVFISYSKSNVPQRKRLESELKILKNEGLLAGTWHDRMIDPGDSWDDVIQRELAEADVVILLISVAALATDYIMEHEIPRALEQRQTGATEVVPVILETCRWEKTALGALNALPDKAKPLNKWKPPADGWNSVSDGLAKLFQKLMENGGQKKPRRPARPSK